MTLVKVKPPTASTPAPQSKDQKELKSEPIPVVEINNESPVDDRVLKVQQLADLVDKREKFAASLKKLQSLNMATEGREITITLEDGKTSWETSNTAAIKLCVETLINSHKKTLSDLEEKICW